MRTAITYSPSGYPAMTQLGTVDVLDYGSRSRMPQETRQCFTAVASATAQATCVPAPLCSCAESIAADASAKYLPTASLVVRLATRE